MENLSWSDALTKLQAGNQHFIQNELTSHKDCLDAARLRSSSGQKPFAIVLSCADSRVVPELTFDVGIGELFVIRVAGNVANKSTIASIEYAVAVLGVNLIVVLGHESCGAITAAMKEEEMGSCNLNYLMSFIAPAVDASANKASINDVVRKNAELTAKLLPENSPIIAKKVDEDQLHIFSAFYNLGSGVVDFLDVCTK